MVTFIIVFVIRITITIIIIIIDLLGCGSKRRRRSQIVTGPRAVGQPLAAYPVLVAQRLTQRWPRALVHLGVATVAIDNLLAQKGPRAPSASSASTPRASRGNIRCSIWRCSGICCTPASARELVGSHDSGRKGQASRGGQVPRSPWHCSRLSPLFLWALLWGFAVRRSRQCLLLCHRFSRFVCSFIILCSFPCNLVYLFIFLCRG